MVKLRVVKDATHGKWCYKVQTKGLLWGWNDVGTYGGYTGDFDTAWYEYECHAVAAMDAYCKRLHELERLKREGLTVVKEMDC